MLFCVCCLIVSAGMQIVSAVCLCLPQEKERQGCKPPDVRHARQLAFGVGIFAHLYYGTFWCVCVGNICL